MRLLAGILRTLAGIVAIFLCIFILVLWVRSYFKGDRFSSMSQDDSPDRLRWSINRLEIGKGGIGFHRVHWSAPPGSIDESPRFVRSAPLSHRRVLSAYPDFNSPPKNDRILGFKFDRYDGWLRNGPVCKVTTIILPLWLLFVILIALSVLPTMRFIRWCRSLVAWFHSLIARSRLSRNLCPHCCYDLRATRDKCPECGYSPSRVESTAVSSPT